MWAKHDAKDNRRMNNVQSNLVIIFLKFFAALNVVHSPAITISCLKENYVHRQRTQWKKKCLKTFLLIVCFNVGGYVHFFVI